jgi:hypothetical protein
VQNIFSIESDEAAIGHHHAQDAFDKGGLSTAVGANQRNTFSFVAGD